MSLAAVGKFVPPKPPGAKKFVPAAPVKAASKAGPASKSAPASKKGNVDFTWGGRPNPTPETTVEEKESFLNAAWRYNRK